jgi:hypothetical protein
MKKLIQSVILLLLSLTLCVSALAAGGLASLKFVMPTGVDPLDLTFTFNGEVLSFFGRDTMPAVAGGPTAPFGVEFRTDGQFIANMFTITPGLGNYTGGLDITTSVDPAYSGYNYTPWNASGPAPYVVLTAAPGSALVGEPDPTLPLPGLPLHSILQYTGGLSGSDLDAFANQEYFVTAQGVPEPGMVAFAVCAGISAGAVALRRKRRR